MSKKEKERKKKMASQFFAQPSLAIIGIYFLSSMPQLSKQLIIIKTFFSLLCCNS
jgi:hypothetical protein